MISMFKRDVKDKKKRKSCIKEKQHNFSASLQKLD